MPRPRVQSLAPARSRSIAEIPILETDRLRLRPYQLTDLEPLAAMWGDPEHVKYIGGRTRGRDEIWVQLQRMIGSWALIGFGYWVLEERNSGTVLGEAGFLEGLRAMEPSHAGSPESGWSIAKSHWGRGFATEALEACLQWADAELSAPRTVCVIEDGHEASIRVAEKCGYTLLRDAVLGESEVGVYQRLRGAEAVD